MHEKSPYLAYRYSIIKFAKGGLFALLHRDTGKILDSKEAIITELLNEIKVSGKYPFSKSEKDQYVIYYYGSHEDTHVLQVCRRNKKRSFVEGANSPVDVIDDRLVVISIAINTGTQIVLIERKQPGLAPEKGRKVIQSLLDTYAHKYSYEVFLKEVVMKGEYEKVIEEGGEILEITFEILGPNMAGRGNKDLQKLLKEFSEEENFDKVRLSATSENGSLTGLSRFFKMLNEFYVEPGFGSWRIRRMLTGQSKSNAEVIKSGDSVVTTNAQKIDPKSPDKEIVQDIHTKIENIDQRTKTDETEQS